MCGIVGLAGRDVGRDSDTGILWQATGTLSHRGPDDGQAWWSDDRCVGLGHRRLAVLDPTPRARQPMHHVDAALTTVLNGEIYNYIELRRDLEGRGHRFASDSDTEVLLSAYAAWDLQCLDRLVGMFAFAIFDRARRRLVLARDRAGEKPLFYAHRARRLGFASEIKALLVDTTLPRSLDAEALDHYLAYGYVPGSRTLLQSVRKLPAGHVMTYDVDTDQLDVWPYWQIPSHRESGTDAGPLIDELDSLLSDSVRMQLRSDVPVGVLLSGGIDSSLVTAMAARHSRRTLKTFTVTFPGNAAYDEAKHARVVAEHFGTEHHELVGETFTTDVLPALARQFDQPIGDSSMLPTYLVARLVRQHATVALGGDGGDELFGGYLHHRWLMQQEWLRRVAGPPLRWMARAALPALPLGVPGRNYVRALTGTHTQAVATMNVLFDRDARRGLAPALRDGAIECDAEAYKRALCPAGATALQQVTTVDAMTYLVDDILTKTDRAGMLASLEVRAPFLDHRVMEFAFSKVPDALRATALARKKLPRMLAARLLPPTLDLKRKQGFSIPLDAWLRGSWGTYIEDVLKAAPRELYDQGAVDRLILGQRRGRRNAQRLFAMTMLELWRREYNVAIA